MRNAAAEYSSFGVFVVEVQGVEIARNSAELLDIGFRNRARVARRLPDFEVLDVMGGYRRRHGFNLISMVARVLAISLLSRKLQPIREQRIAALPHQFAHRGHGMDVMLPEQ